MRRQGQAGRRTIRRKRASRARVFGLVIAAAIGPFASTSIARQDASSLLPRSEDLAGFGRGHYLAAAPIRPVELASLEAADLFGAGRGPMAAPNLLDGGALMVLDLPEDQPEATEKSRQPAPFVDRTLKGDREAIGPEHPVPAAPRAETAAPDPFAALPSIVEARAIDLTGLDMLPRIDSRLASLTSRKVAETSRDLADASRAPRAPIADDSELSASAGLTAVPMTPREAGSRHDGATPSVAAMNGGRVPPTTTPKSETPLAVAALPVLRRPGATQVTPAERGRTTVAITPDMGVEPGGETVAIRGDLDGDGTIETRVSHRVLIPANLLARSEQCLAEAIYFEARGESKEGQYAVAQVVMNRVRSGFYPDNVCGVVYQNVHRRNACQFSFACDRIPDRVTNRHAWNLAVSIARDVTRGGAWLPSVGDSTHYHATYVRPNWIRDMVKEDKIGSHIFYRVRWRAPLDV